MLRCGVWKARTNPNSFNGAGDIAIDWLYNISKELNLPVATEVGIPQHVEKALKKRDFMDKNRKESPLLFVKGAVLVDTTKINVKQMKGKLISIVKKAINKKYGNL